MTDHPSLDAVLSDLAILGLWIDRRDDDLRVVGPVASADQGLLTRLRASKPALLELLREAERELVELLGEMQTDREWLRAERLLPSDDLAGVAYAAFVEGVRRRCGLLSTLAVVRAHYAKHVIGNLPHLERPHGLT